MNAYELAENIYYSVAWDEMHGCVEAAPSDCPHKQILGDVFKCALSLDSILASLEESDRLARFIKVIVQSDVASSRSDTSVMMDAENTERLCRLALRVRINAKKTKDADSESTWMENCYLPIIEKAGASCASQPWSLPNMSHELPENEANHWIAREVLKVREVKVLAAIPAILDSDFEKNCMEPITNPMAYASSITSEATIPVIMESMSPYVQSAGPTFFGTIFHSSLCEGGALRSDGNQFYRSHRYSHLATSTLLRQLHSFGIDAPVFGVIFCGSKLAVHIDWVSQIDGQLYEINSAFFTNDEVMEDLKVWDLRDPVDALHVVTILDNIRLYNSTHFTSTVKQGILSAHSSILCGDFKGWRWNGEMLIEDAEGCHGASDEAGEVASSQVSSISEEQHSHSVDYNPVVNDVENESLSHPAASDDLRKAELLAAALTLEKSGLLKKIDKRILPSPPRTPAEASGAGTPALGG